MFAHAKPERKPGRRATIAAMEEYELGDVRLVRFVDGFITYETPAPTPAWCVPDYTPAAELVRLDFGAFALEVDGRRIVVDPWLVTDGARALPDAPEHAERLEAELRDAGFPPDSVDLVVFSHIEGVGWSVRPGDDGPVPMFPNARWVLGASGVAAWRDGTIEGAEDLQVLLDAGVVDQVATDARLSEHVTLRPTEGHTPGHAVVAVDTGDGPLALAGHLFLYPHQVADPSVSNDFDPARAETERRALLDELGASGGLLFGQLIGGRGGGRVVHDGDTYRLEPLPLEPIRLEPTGT
jgi:glyoxylase-like metal-dependent hydrolase (beta-lactamase superfamily II)